MRLVALGIYRLILGFKAGILLSAIPLLLFSLEGSQAELSLWFAIPTALSILLLPIIGYYSDRMGQRRTILILEIVGLMVFFTLTQTNNILILLSLSGLSFGALRISNPISLAGVSQSKRRGLVLGILKTVGDLSGIFGAIIGASAVVLGSSAIITVLGAVSTSSLFASFFIPEALTKNRKSFGIELPKVVTYPIIAAVLWAGSGFVIEPWWDPMTLGLTTPTEAGFIALAVAVTLLGANISAGILLDKNSRALIKIGMLIDAVLLFIAPLTGNFLLTGIIRLARIIPFALQGILLQKTAIDSGKDRFGLSLGVAGALLLIAETLFPLAGRIIADLAGYTGVYWLAALLSCSAFLILKYY